MFTIPQESTDLCQFDCLTPDNKSAIPVIECQPKVDFAVNSFGWPLNDISALNGCKSLQEYELISQRLNQYQAQNPDTSKLSTAELIQAVEPHSFQTPSEVMRFAEYYARHLQRNIDEISSKRAAIQQAKSKASSDGKVIETTPE